ncbi:MAG: prepilin-type N-terminal cleavage/methylation domain-containing protein [Deltaproteobacteria bacterium]|nr:prepilin-type N-terminal cleavage/methylation domain-containing protein [Deltaproteobacteria bacterium]
MKTILLYKSSFSKVSNRSGFTLIEMAVVMVIVGIIISIMATVLPSLIHSGKIKKAQADLQRADLALQGYISATGRCPCPDTNGDGEENRNDGGTLGNTVDDTCAAYVGNLPYLTLGLSSPDDVWKNPIKYAVYSDLITFSTPTGSNSFCTGLDNIIKYYDSQGDNNPTDTSKLYTTNENGQDPKNKAYILVSGGNKDLDGDGSDGLFDGNNEGLDLKFDLPDRSAFHGDPTSKRYDDLIRAASFSYIKGSVGCSVGGTGGSGGTTAGENTFPDGCTNGIDDDGDGYTDCDDQDCYGVGACGTGGENVTIITNSIPAEPINSSYSATFQATGGITPYEWTMTNNGGFSGLFLHTYTGMLSGNLDQCEGTYTIEVQVSDSTLPSDGGPRTDTKQFSLQVNANLNVSRTSGSGTSITWNSPTQHESFQANGEHLGDINWNLNSGGATGFSVFSTGSDTCDIRKDGATTPGLYTFILTATDALCPGNTADITLIVDVTSAGAVAPYTVGLGGEWHLNECTWNGTDDEIRDSTDTFAHGRSFNMGTSDDSDREIGKICRGAAINIGTTTNQYIELGHEAFNNLGDFSLAMWFRVDSLSSSLSTLFSGSDGSQHNTMLIYLNNIGTTFITHLNGPQTGNFNIGSSLADGLWHHMVWTWQSSDGAEIIYLDGAALTDSNGGTNTSNIILADGGVVIGQEQDSLGGGFAINQLFSGWVDEVMMFSQLLDSSDVNDLVALTHSCSDTCYRNPVAIYYMDESTWTIGNPDVLDSSGNNHHGAPLETAVGGVGINTNGRFNNCGEFVRIGATTGRIEINGLPVSTSIGDRTTVTFWMNWHGANSQMPIGWQTYDLWFTSGNFGFNTGGGDVFGISGATAMLANNWHHVAAVFTNRDPAHNVLYIDGVEQSLSLLQGTQNTNRSVGANLRISSWLNNTGYSFDGLIDELRVYDRGLSGSEIVEDYNITR